MLKNRQEKNISEFSKDAVRLGGYIYTSNQKLSSLLANDHITGRTLSLLDLTDKKIFDIGCGDGVYTQELNSKGKPRSILAIDPSIEAIKTAKKNNRHPERVSFRVGDIYSLPRLKFDIAIVRGVIHHLYRPEKAICEISKIAKTILIIEPNGYNPVLKIIEKVSTYHIEHEEKSFPPFLIDRWIRNNSGTIKVRKFAGLVPFFCPNYLASFLKRLEPAIEKIPLINKILCAQYYVIYDLK